MNQQVATALVILANEPEGELSAAGVSARELSDTALALFRYSLRTHATGDVNCTDGRKWGQLADDPESWPETSGSAMFAYAIAMGLEHGWLEGGKWLDSTRRAWRALCDRLDGFGNISDVCVGTNKKNDRAYYLARGRANGDPHGQAPMLWLAGVLGRIGISDGSSAN